MKIDLKLPMNRELAEFMLQHMSCEHIGEAFCAALDYALHGNVGDVSWPARQTAEDLRRMIDTSRRRADAGRVGGKNRGRIEFATGKMDLLQAKQQERAKPEPPPVTAQDDALLLDGLGAFL